MICCKELFLNNYRNAGPAASLRMTDICKKLQKTIGNNKKLPQVIKSYGEL
jgi:hypothetical protein